MRVSVSEEARVPLDAAWAWWTDFGEPGETMMVGHGFGPPMRRRIVSREKDRVEFEEQMPLPGGRGLTLAKRVVTLHDGHWFTERARGRFGFNSEWRFESTADGGTRITRELVLKSGPVDASGALGERAARAWMARDLAFHVRELERDVRD